MIQKNNEERGMEYGENDGGREEERDQGKWKMENGGWKLGKFTTATLGDQSGSQSIS